MDEDLYMEIQLLLEGVEVPESTDEVCMEVIKKCIAEKGRKEK